MTRNKWGFRSLEQLEDHFLWHGDELGLDTVDDYGQEAFDLFHKPLDENWQECEQTLGRVRYHFVTQQVLFLSRNGRFINSYFKKSTRPNQRANNAAWFRNKCQQ